MSLEMLLICKSFCTRNIEDCNKFRYLKKIIYEHCLIGVIGIGEKHAPVDGVAICQYVCYRDE